jgi:hypothetical protein
LCQQICHTRWLSGDHCGDSGFAPICPARGRGLGVKVKHGGPQAALFGGNSQVNGHGRLPSAAFLADNSDCFHGCMFAPKGVFVVENIHANVQTYKQQNL